MSRILTPTPAMYFMHGSVSTASRMSFSASSASRAAVASPGPALSGTTSCTLENDCDAGEPEPGFAAASCGALLGDFADIFWRVRESVRRTWRR